MAVTILERPEGHILDTAAQTATVSSSYGAGDAQFVSPTVHGLVDGDFIYAESNIEDYAGFWYVDALTTGIFKIKRYSAGDYVQFIADGTITWYKSNLAHGWSAVHLPITYRLSNNLFPVNSSDTVRNVSSTQDANGYTVLLISGSLGSGVNTYDFLDLVAPNDTDLSGPYQILEFISPTVLLINLAYDSTNNFTSATVQKRYNNYNFVVRVYVGINASHQWANIKPYELAATLLFIPDENNETFFSVNEIVKSYIETRNNLTLGTLPNNTDFWANFYIEVAESYDDSDGYAFGTFTSNYTSDQGTFEGTGVNADLEFKNIYSGYLSEYLMTNSAAKFLTLFAIPVIFSCGDDTPDCYSDISFLIDSEYSITLRKEFYIQGVLQTTVDTDMGVLSSGVIRAELEADCTYDRVDISLKAISDLENEEFDTSDDWSNESTGSTWTIAGGAAGASFVSGQSPYDTKDFFQSILLPEGGIVTFTTEYTVSSIAAGSGRATMRVHFYSGGSVVSTSTMTQSIGAGTFQRNVTDVVIPAGVDGIAFSVLAVNPDEYDLSVAFFRMTEVSQTLSETKTFDIECGCANNEIRLTWLNNLGGFDYWAFTAKKDHIVEIQEAMVTKKNILPTWPKSYGSQADTIKKQTLRVSNKAYTVRSQIVNESNVDALAYIKSSVLVQIINSRIDRRTVIVDTESFVIRKDGDKTHEIAFNISFTDDIPVQTV